MPARTQAATRNIDRDIGALGEAVENLGDMLKSHMALQSDFQKDMRAVVTSLGEALRTQQTEMAEVKPLAVEYRTARDQRKGAAKLLRGVYTFLILVGTLGAGVVGYKVHGTP